MNLLRASYLTKTFVTGPTTTQLFNKLSLTLEQGKTYALQGVSGSGKSTLLHILAGLEEPTSGSITIGTYDLSLLNPQERAQKIVLATQTPFFIKELSVIENIALAHRILGKTEKSATEQALWWLEQVGLWHTRDWNMAYLSGGQRQRVALARALSVKPAFLLADEPTGSLDAKSGQEIVDLLLKLQKQEGMGIVISTHDRTVAQQMDLVFTIKDGILVSDFESPNPEDLYERNYAEKNDLTKNSSSRW